MTIETFPYGITREKRYDRRLVIVQTQGDMSDEAVDTWADLLLDVIREMPDEGAFFLIDDLSHPNQSITPHAMKRSREILSATPRYRDKLYIAVVLSNSFVNRFARVLLKQFLSFGSNVIYGIFTSRDDADRWIAEKMRQEGIIDDDG